MTSLSLLAFDDALVTPSQTEVRTKTGRKPGGITRRQLVA